MDLRGARVLLLLLLVPLSDSQRVTPILPRTGCLGPPVLCCSGMNLTCQRGCFCDEYCVFYDDCCPDRRRACQRPEDSATTPDTPPTTTALPVSRSSTTKTASFTTTFPNSASIARWTGTETPPTSEAPSVAERGSSISVATIEVEETPTTMETWTPTAPSDASQDHPSSSFRTSSAEPGSSPTYSHTSDVAVMSTIDTRERSVATAPSDLSAEVPHRLSQTTTNSWTNVPQDFSTMGQRDGTTQNTPSEIPPGLSQSTAPKPRSSTTNTWLDISQDFVTYGLIETPTTMTPSPEHPSSSFQTTTEPGSSPTYSHTSDVEVISTVDPRERSVAAVPSDVPPDVSLSLPQARTTEPGSSTPPATSPSATGPSSNKTPKPGSSTVYTAQDISEHISTIDLLETPADVSTEGSAADVTTPSTALADVSRASTTVSTATVAIPSSSQSTQFKDRTLGGLQTRTSPASINTSPSQADDVTTSLTQNTSTKLISSRTKRPAMRGSVAATFPKTATISRRLTSDTQSKPGSSAPYSQVDIRGTFSTVESYQTPGTTGSTAPSAVSAPVTNKAPLPTDSKTTAELPSSRTGFQTSKFTATHKGRGHVTTQFPQTLSVQSTLSGATTLRTRPTQHKPKSSRDSSYTSTSLTTQFKRSTPILPAEVSTTPTLAATGPNSAKLQPAPSPSVKSPAETSRNTLRPAEVSSKTTETKAAETALFRVVLKASVVSGEENEDAIQQILGAYLVRALSLQNCDRCSLSVRQTKRH